MNALQMSCICVCSCNVSAQPTRVDLLQTKLTSHLPCKQGFSNASEFVLIDSVHYPQVFLQVSVTLVTLATMLTPQHTLLCVSSCYVSAQRLRVKVLVTVLTHNLACIPCNQVKFLCLLSQLL